MVHARQSQPHPLEKSRELQRRLYLAAKRNRSRRFHALYDRIVRPDVLWRAWEEVRANRGRAGVDGVRIEDVERDGVAAYLTELAADLKAEVYRPQPVLRVKIIVGWRAYFAIGNSTKKLADLDRYVWLRLSGFLRKRQGPRGRLYPAAFGESERRSGLAYFYPPGRRGLKPRTS